MKNLDEYIIESISNDIINKIKLGFNKLFSAGIREWDKNTKWLHKFVRSNHAIKRIEQSFDIEDQKNTGYELCEWGALENVKHFASVNDIPQKDVKKIIDYIKNGGNNEWKISSVNEDWIWFLGALEAWGIDFKDISEKDCIDSCEDFYEYNY